MGSSQFDVANVEESLNSLKDGKAWFNPGKRYVRPSHQFEQ